MARKPRSFVGNVVYHVLNRASARARIFHNQADYAAFEKPRGRPKKIHQKDV